jgi:type IV pilus assembly protein PilA
VRTRIAEKDGFTLIELMIVIVIMGVLAAMAVTTWQNRKEEAIVAGMKSDLRNLASAEEAYYVDKSTYTTDTDALGIRSSPDVVLTLQADANGWTANTAHPTTTRECGMYFGKIAPLSPARGEGIVWCE